MNTVEFNKWLLSEEGPVYRMDQTKSAEITYFFATSAPMGGLAKEKQAIVWLRELAGSHGALLDDKDLALSMLSKLRHTPGKTLSAVVEMAGRPYGLLCDDDHSSPMFNLMRGEFMEPDASVDWSGIDALEKGLFHDETTRDVVKSWVWQARTQAMTGVYAQIPILILIGASDSGKTFFAEKLVAAACGGYPVADLGRIIKNRSRFTDGLARCFLWSSDDPTIGRWDDKAAEASVYKRFMSNPSMTWEGKGQAELHNVMFNRVMTICCNDGEDSLRALPAVSDEAMRDKLIITKVGRINTKGYPTFTEEQKGAYRAFLFEGLPGWLHSCKEAYERMQQRPAIANAWFTQRSVTPGYRGEEAGSLLQDAEGVETMAWMLDTLFDRLAEEAWVLEREKGTGCEAGDIPFIDRGERVSVLLDVLQSMGSGRFTTFSAKGRRAMWFQPGVNGHDMELEAICKQDLLRGMNHKRFSNLIHQTVLAFPDRFVSEQLTWGGRSIRRV